MTAAAAVASVFTGAGRDVEGIKMEPPSPPLTPPTLQSPIASSHRLIPPPPSLPHRLLSDQLVWKARPRSRPRRRRPGPKEIRRDFPERLLLWKQTLK